MSTSIVQLKEIVARHLMVIILVALAAVEALSVAALVQAPSQPGLLIYGEEERGVAVTQPILRISEIRGPMIDSEAAMIVVDESSVAAAAAPACATLPLPIWIFLLIAYTALLIFNFSYTFRQAVHPQWFWETLYTALFIAGWFAWDGCCDHIWFPFAVVKSGLITFAIYAYLLEKKVAQKPLV